MFIDCTYEGDLMAMGGVQFTVGRESQSQYAEPTAGRRPLVPAECYGFRAAVDPFASGPGPSRETLPMVWGGALAGVGEARPSPIPSLCTHCTRAGIEWRR